MEQKPSGEGERLETESRLGIRLQDESRGVCQRGLGEDNWGQSIFCKARLEGGRGGNKWHNEFL